MRKSLKIILHRKAVKELNSLSSTMRSRIVESLREMERNPFTGDVKPLKGFRGIFRRRVGDYRIIFTVIFEENTILVFRVSHRGKVYGNI